jgi:hypothetical protein
MTLANLASSIMQNPAAIQDMNLEDTRDALWLLLNAIILPLLGRFALLSDRAGRKRATGGERLIPIDEAALRMGGLSPRTLIAHRDEFSFITKVGGRWMASEAGLDKWIAEEERQRSVGDRKTRVLPKLRLA